MLADDAGLNAALEMLVVPCVEMANGVEMELCYGSVRATGAAL